VGLDRNPPYIISLPILIPKPEEILQKILAHTPPTYIVQKNLSTKEKQKESPKERGGQRRSRTKAEAWAPEIETLS
jgi:hypothetical protein